jgi:drug/metabolite transporter (DMT)-like permease
VRPTLALLAVSALWGTTFATVKVALEDCSPMLFVAARFALATAGSAFLAGGSAGLRAALRPGILLGVALALGYATQTIGLTLTTPSRSAFVTGVNVALVPLWALLLLRRRTGLLSLCGLAVAVPGLWLLTDPGTGSWGAGETWTLLCAVFFALHVVLLAGLPPDRPVGALLIVQLAACAVLCLAAAMIIETPRLAFGPRLAGALLLTALLATTGTTWLQLRYQPRVEPTRAALIYTTEPVFASVFSWLVLRETLHGLAWAGAGLILTGMVLAELGPARAAGSERATDSRQGGG